MPSANRISLLRDADADGGGSAEVRTTFLDSLNAPFGMALVGSMLYFANTDAVVSVPYDTGSTAATARAVMVIALPAGLRNHHWTKDIIAQADGTNTPWARTRPRWRLVASATSVSWPPPFGTGVFVGQHGLWNLTPRRGYKVILVPFSGGTPSAGPALDVLTDVVTDDGKAMGRPVGVAIDTRGGLLVADDVGNVVWRVQNAAPQAARDAAEGLR